MSNNTSDPGRNQKSGLLTIAGILLFGTVGLVLFSEISPFRKHEITSTQMPDVAAKTSSRTDGSVSNVTRTIKPGTRGERAKLLVNDVAVRDGQRLIEHSTADFFLAYQIMTNFGVPADLAKTQLRPILNRLAAVADSNRHIIVEGERHIKELDAARNDPSTSTLEKAMLMQGLAVSRDVFLERMTELRDQNLGELALLVEALGVNGSDDLLKRIKRVEPIEFPPDRDTK